MLAERFGKVPDVRGDVFARNPNAGVFDIQHARDVLGYEPEYGWRDFGRR